ncbi:hypothetical protein [Azospirillum palustre]
MIIDAVCLMKPDEWGPLTDVIALVKRGLAPAACLLGVVVEIIPDEWTAWELYSHNRKTAFHAELKKLSDEGEEEGIYGRRAPTPALALLIAILESGHVRP